MKFNLIFVMGILFLLVGCNSQTDRLKEDGTTWGAGSFSSNGERIYFTATSKSGSEISYTGGPGMGMMMKGGSYSCASCHGVDAKGGKHVMHMEEMNAPDIRWSALSEDHHDEHENEKHEQEESEEHHHGNYTFEDFRNAVVNGKHPDGENLDSDMPRWKISDADLRDLMEYLKSIN